MGGGMKNIAKGEVLRLDGLVPYQEGQVVSRTLAQNPHVSLTLFAFEKGEEISTHASGGDALVTVLEGTGRFTVGGEMFFRKRGLRKNDFRFFARSANSAGGRGAAAPQRRSVKKMCQWHIFSVGPASCAGGMAPSVNGGRNHDEGVECSIDTSLINFCNGGTL